MRPLYSADDRERVLKIANDEDYREDWRRDYARLIHSAGFRRLQGKTQVFPGHEGDFFRNRLTHSLEVAQIAKSIAIKLNAESEYFAADDQKIYPDIVEFAGLAHDLGHPPFGHNGEEALDECMRNDGGFEGNAQTLRILSRLEKKSTLANDVDLKLFSPAGEDLRCGLNVSYRSLASILKYDTAIPLSSKERPEGDEKKVMKGYYNSDVGLVSDIKKYVIGAADITDFKTIECSIMDIADDIAYSTYDLEDIFKSGFHKPLDLFGFSDSIYAEVVKTINKRLEKQYPDDCKPVSVKDVHEILFDVFSPIFRVDEEDAVDTGALTPTQKMLISVESQTRSRIYADNGYARTAFTSKLVGLFIQGIEVVPHATFPQLHRARLKRQTFVMVEALKNITFEAVIRAPTLQVVEYRGKDILKRIFRALSRGDGARLLPPDFRDIYLSCHKEDRKRTICDFIAGMTDRYAVEFYSRLFGATGLTMHKPF
ncbi:dGTP triphosphohydrolase [Agrobacterium pusense]|uniref:dGTP triphosphohydrolase n=1 Tax=Agrobacterium pusense TaxID=648995 RepID=UPI002FDE21CB